MPIFYRISFLFLLSVFLFSCTKEEGVGGNSSIEGTVYTTEINQASGIAIETYPSKDKRVYIIYGNGEIPADDQRTNYQGKFKFDFLTKGNYTIYVYSDCDSCPGGETAIQKDIEITAKKVTVSTGDISIVKLID